MSKKFKIAIDVSPLSDGNASRGVGHYTKMLLPALRHEIKTNPLYHDFDLQLVTDNSQLKTDFDLVHYPYFDPFYLTLPPKKSGQKRIITIHDLIPLEYPEHFPVGIRGNLKWQLQRYRARQSDFIITVSHTAKYAISDILKYPADKIYVTYEAADATYKKSYPSSYLKKIKAKYNLPEQFVLNVGDANWNKNIPTLVRACHHLQRPLVLVGSSLTNPHTPDHPWTADIRYIQQFNSPYLKLTGFVPDEDLPGIFKLASVYCQPSFAEGFGLSPVKGLQVGTPVAYSSASCLPEIMDYAGVFFDPYSQKSLEKALNLLLTDKKLRSDCTKKGFDRIKIFNWQFTALGTLAVYRLALLNESA